MRFGSVCSGIEAASVAWYPLGWRAAWLSEIDASASAVLAHRFPNVPNLGDMTEIAPLIEAGIVEAPDILVGGTPCQGYSVAGRRGGLSDPRGQLILSFVEIADAIDDARRANGKPECIITWENVPGVLSMRDNSFGHFLASLAGEDCALEPSGKRWPDAGLVLGPQRAIAWRCLDAQFFGLAQRRKRVFVVASARQGFDPGEILLEWEGVRRDSPPSRQTGQEIAGTLDARAEAGGFPGTDGACANRVVPADAGGRLTNRLSPAFCGGNCKGPIPVATALNANERFDFDSETFIVEPTECVTGSVTHTLTAEGFDASEDGTGRGNPIVPIAFTAKDYGQNATEDMSPTLRSGAHSDSHANGGVMPAVAYSIRTAQTGANGIGVDEHLSPTLDVAGSPSVCYSFKPGMSEAAGGLMPTEDVAPTLQAADNGSTRTPAVAYAIQERAICENPDAGPDGIGVREDVAYTLEARQTPQAIGFVQNSSEVRLMGGDGAIAGALAAEPGAQQQTYIASHMAVRRLMPVECERLQGFPDEWTRIPVKFFTTKQVSALRPDDMWEVGFGPGNRPGWWLMAADGPRYKQCGNSMARNCMAWIGGRIKDWLQLEPFRELIG